MLHIPALRAGKPYTSLEKTTLVHHADGSPIAEVSQVNGSMIARDLAQAAQAKKALAAIPFKELVGMYAKAADYFVNGTLPMGDSEQTFDDYIRSLSSTTGSPMVFCRRNAAKVEYVLRNVETVLGGLTRGVDLTLLDRGYGEQDGRMQCFYSTTDAFGAILPSNSPGVHSLWVPTLALKTPLVLKPGREEPWTPFRVLQAFLKAGLPASAIFFYPTDHAGAGDILRLTNRSMLFGDSRTTDPYKNDHRVELHGPGYSKILLGEDMVDRWEEFVDVMVECIAANGGRSCINVSAIWTPRHGKAIAEAVGAKLAKVKARSWDDPEAELAAFGNPDVANAISNMVDEGLKSPGATDVTEQIRGSHRLVKEGRCAWILPTIVLCDSPNHTLANKEFLFPYASVVECPQRQYLSKIGPSLAVMALTEDDAFIRQLLDTPLIERLNVGPLPTTRLTWDQPHEGNLFTHLYRQRAFQQARRTAAVV
ncbi:aldehyde dehydrogenase family protein [Tuwongella immobilis]|uniref:Aldehyde dehydrogenase domain-containing protein n=1 Tax=Tuwongella immobilis TaxID=692036 RepID=A0A6C2YT76_9BACT|nr:aldehyde dehydrogenase family protein [Tuwongella immobilis]VIP04666.1 aldehyde dehydrogenase : Putative NAD-dependent aldehyde dehydrogenase OS=Pedosphaera parvula (strain Ellin514) GN=Cflav_PD1195 PE=4 SV=1: Aldedh [Tuwongella immobilis]VTS06693.1 aldehyde dehydrogenase : Putative NAD-dependent aldehyde dehydrogenase OS=Pedosphaera parvula (strain Ellin514) GN=Cflav_PD1195 PE=4 SV=1: Aldedh [Tuwongella immobilis]